MPVMNRSKFPAIEYKTVGTATVDIGRYLGLNFDGDLPGLDGEPIMGFTNRKISKGDLISVISYGEAYAISAEALTKGDRVFVDTAGKAAKTGAGTEILCAVVLDGATGIDEVIRVNVYRDGTNT